MDGLVDGERVSPVEEGGRSGESLDHEQHGLPYPPWEGYPRIEDPPPLLVPDAGKCVGPATGERELVKVSDQDDRKGLRVCVRQHAYKNPPHQRGEGAVRTTQSTWDIVPPIVGLVLVQETRAVGGKKAVSVRATCLCCQSPPHPLGDERHGSALFFPSSRGTRTARGQRRHTFFFLEGGRAGGRVAGEKQNSAQTCGPWHATHGLEAWRGAVQRLFFARSSTPPRKKKGKRERERKKISGGKVHKAAGDPPALGNRQKDHDRSLSLSLCVREIAPR